MRVLVLLALCLATVPAQAQLMSGTNQMVGGVRDGVVTWYTTANPQTSATWIGDLGYTSRVSEGVVTIERDGVVVLTGELSGVAVLWSNGSGGSFAISPTGISAGCSFVLSAGATTQDTLDASTPADFDADADVDLADFSAFAGGFTGPYGSSATDLDADGDADLEDFALFQNCFNGPNRGPACLE